MPRVRRLPWLLFLLAMFAGSALITANSLVYFDFGAVAPFVVERLPERFASLWLASLRVHVAAALVSLPLCLMLTFRWLQRRPVWHRWIGRVVGVIVLVALVPSGVVLSFHAKGGASVTAGFLLSAAIVGAAMGHGVLAARFDVSEARIFDQIFAANRDAEIFPVTIRLKHRERDPFVIGASIMIPERIEGVGAGVARKFLAHDGARHDVQTL